MINFYLPDFYYFYNFNIKLIELLNEYPEYFKYKLKIAAVYGCFPNQIWNGGRYITGKFADIDNIITTIKSFNENYNIPIRFTYTNNLITEEHLNDYQCNIITDIAHNGKNEILVNSSLLEEYLRNKYPNFKYISSATRCIRDIDKLNKLLDDDKYYLVLGDYRDNFNIEFLNNIKNKNKLEILINPYCKLDCKLRELHYKVLSQLQLNQQVDRNFNCPCEYLHWFDVEKSNNIIKTDQLQQYIDMSFFNFKIEGRRMHPVDVIDSYIYYLIKDQYKDKIRNILLRSIYPSQF